MGYESKLFIVDKHKPFVKDNPPWCEESCAVHSKFCPHCGIAMENHD